MFFDSNSDYQTVTIKSSDDWQVTSEADWCQISPDKGVSGETVVTIFVSDNDSEEDRMTTLSFVCNDVSEQISIVQYGMFETDFIDLRLNEENVKVKYDENTGNLSVNYGESAIPEVTIGKAFILPDEYQYDIRVIESFDVENETVTFQTKEGDMGNLFHNIDFTLTTNPDLVSSTRSCGRVITPSSIVLTTGNKSQIIYKRNAASTKDIYIQPQLFSMYEDYSGDVLCEGDWGHFQWEKCVYRMGLDAVFYFDFKETFFQFLKKGDLQTFRFYLDGYADFDMLLKYYIEKEYSYAKKGVFKENVLPVLKIEFKVGNIPIYVTLNTHMGRRVTFNSEANIRATAGFNSHTDVRIGLEYDRQNNNLTPITSFYSDFSLHDPTLNAQGSATATTSLYPEFELKLYKFLGPRIDLIPYIGNRIESGAQVSMSGNNYLSWTNEVFSGFDATLGLDLDWIGSPISVESIDFIGEEKLLVKSPEEIQLEYPENNTAINLGEEIEVGFRVFSKNYLDNELYNAGHAVVLLETDGKLEEDIIIADENGLAKVNWIPLDPKDKLIAKIVDKAGETISEAEFQPSFAGVIDAFEITEAIGSLGGGVEFFYEIEGNVGILDEDVQQVGLYYEDGIEKELSVSDDGKFGYMGSVQLDINMMDSINHQDFFASKSKQIGLYIVKEGNPFYLNPQDFQFIYNQEPKVVFTKIKLEKKENLTEDGIKYIKDTYRITFEIEGAFFMKTFSWESLFGSGNPIIISYSSVRDGEMSVIFPIKYPVDFSSSGGWIRYCATTHDGQTIYSDNYIQWKNRTLNIVRNAY